MRMKDNDLLVTQLFEDPLKEPITALSVYYTPISCKYLRNRIMFRVTSEQQSLEIQLFDYFGKYSMYSKQFITRPRHTLLWG